MEIFFVIEQYKKNNMKQENNISIPIFPNEKENLFLYLFSYCVIVPYGKKTVIYLGLLNPLFVQCTQ